MIRPARPEDTPGLVALAEGTGVFKPAEIVALREVLDDYHREAHARGHRAAAFEQDGRPIGFVYFAPASMTDRTWYLYWIAVARQVQARGTGSALLGHAEDEIRREQGRLLLVETSSLPHYEPTRKFYAKQGYEVTAVLADFYSDGDDLVIFRKRLDERAARLAVKLPRAREFPMMDRDASRRKGGDAMALLTIEGIYKDGRVELSEIPGSVEAPARVLVTFLPAASVVERDPEREALRQQAFAQMRKGIDLGGPPYPTREELHERTR